MDSSTLQKVNIDPAKIDIYAKPKPCPDPSSIGTNYPTSAAHNAVLPFISEARQFLWKYSDAVKARYTALTTNSSSFITNWTEFVDSAQKDPSILARPGLVGAAYVGGLLAPGRGRKPLQRLLFSAGGVTLAAAILYPNQMLDAAKREMEYVKSKTVSLWSESSGDKTQETAPTLRNQDETAVTVESLDETVKTDVSPDVKAINEAE